MEPTTTTADELLILSLKNHGDRQAFELLVRRHKRRAYLLALKLLGDHDEAMDASQEAFVKLFERADRYSAGRPFLPWFLGIVRNCARSLWRSKLRLRRVRLDDLLQHLEDTSADPSSSVRSAERWRAVLSLPLKLREVVVLRHLDGMDYKQIADVLELPVNTVAGRLHKARKELACRYEV